MARITGILFHVFVILSHSLYFWTGRAFSPSLSLSVCLPACYSSACIKADNHNNNIKASTSTTSDNSPAKLAICCEYEQNNKNWRKKKQRNWYSPNNRKTLRVLCVYKTFSYENSGEISPTVFFFVLSLYLSLPYSLFSCVLFVVLNWREKSAWEHKTRALSLRLCSDQARSK